MSDPENETDDPYQMFSSPKKPEKEVPKAYGKDAIGLGKWLNAEKDKKWQYIYWTLFTSYLMSNILELHKLSCDDFWSCLCVIIALPPPFHDKISPNVYFRYDQKFDDVTMRCVSWISWWLYFGHTRAIQISELFIEFDSYCFCTLHKSILQ